MIAKTNFTCFALGGDCAHRAIRNSQRMFIADQANRAVEGHIGAVSACLPLEIPRPA